MKFVATYIFCLTNILFGLTQTVNLDSLRTYLQTAKNDTNKVKALIEVGKFKNYNEGTLMLKEALDLSEKINFPLGIIHTKSILGSFEEGVPDFHKALRYYEEGSLAAEKNGNVYEIFQLYGQVLNASFYLGDYPKAMQTTLKRLQLSQKINNKYEIANSFSLFVFIYLRQNNLVKAKEYNYKFLKIAEELKSQNMMATAYTVISDIHANEGNYKMAIEELFKVLKIYDTLDVVVRRKKPDNNTVRQMMCGNYNNIASMYKVLGNNKLALEYSSKCLSLCNIIINKTSDKPISGINLYELASYYITNGEIHCELNNLNKAEESLSYGLKLSLDINHKEDLKVAYYALAELNFKKNNFKLALNYRKKFATIKDSILNEKSTKQMAEMNTRYESEIKDKELLKKDSEIKDQQTEAKHQSILRNAFLSGFVLVFFLALFIYRNYRQKHKVNIAISKQKLIIEEKNKSITDSIHYAKRIQNSLLPHENYIIKNIERLKNIL